MGNHKRRITETPKRPNELKRIKEQVQAQTEKLAEVQKLAQPTAQDGTMAKLLDLMIEMQRTMNSLLELVTTESKDEPTETAADLKEKRRSLVISGLPESNKTVASERRMEDRKLIEKLMDELDVEAEPVSIYRLPSSQANSNVRPRLIKLILATSKQQGEILKNSKKLKTSQHFKGTYIRPSMNKEERQLDYELRQAAKKLREQGNHRVHIKGFKLFVGETQYDHVSLSPLN